MRPCASDVVAPALLVWNSLEEETRGSSTPECFAGNAQAAAPLLESPSALAEGTQNVHTLSMNLKNAAFLALVGMIPVTILLMAVLIGDALAVVRGLIPVVRVLTSFIYAFAS